MQEKNITVYYINQHNWAKKKLYRYLNKNILVSNSFTHKTFENKDKIMTKYWNFACRCHDLERKIWISLKAKPLEISVHTCTSGGFYDKNIRIILKTWQKRFRFLVINE